LIGAGDHGKLPNVYISAYLGYALKRQQRRDEKVFPRLHIVLFILSKFRLHTLSHRPEVAIAVQRRCGELERSSDFATLAP
jgi:hypothetical protein